MNEEHNKQEEYVRIEELDDIEDDEGNIIPNDNPDPTNIDAALNTHEADSEDAIGMEEDSAERGGNAKEDLRRALQGGGDDKNDE